MGDSVEFAAPGRFTLLGRADRNVKILEKYVSLPEVEAALERHAFVARAHALASREAVPRVWALVEPTAEGWDALKRFGYGATTARLKRETVGVASFAFPRRIRYVGRFPYNEQGKLVNAEMYPLLRSRYQEPVSENESVREDGFSADLTFIADAFYFDGHFKDFKILPGVVQLDYVERRISRQWRLAPFSGEVLRLKFQRPVLPGETVRLAVDRIGDDRYSFSVTCASAVCTSGVMVRKETK
jgi:3-hydroxymyristoyl/3-hydroxydecanoyl-(acyl carrier protein) dehydratase